MVAAFCTKSGGPERRPVPPAGAASRVRRVLELRLQPLDRRGQFAGQHRQRPRGAPSTTSRRPPCDRRARPPQTNVSRVAPLNRSQPATAMTPIMPVCGHVGAAARRQVEVGRPRPAATRPVRTGSLRSGSRGGLLLGDEPHGHRPVLPHDAIGVALRPRRSRAASLRAPDRSSRSRRPGESSSSARRTADRTRPRARAGRCAAACDRGGAASRSRPCTGAPARESARRSTCANLAGVVVDDVETRAPPSVPVSCGWPPDVG